MLPLTNVTTEKRMQTYSVGIIGLGNIGMLYDYNDLTDNLYLSHAKSFFRHPSFHILFLLDKDINKLELARNRFGEGIQYLNDVDQITSLPQILVLASLPSINLKIVERFKDNQEIKLFLIEKPFWDTTINEEQLLPYSERCYINYFRKYLPIFQELSRGIQTNLFGQPVSCLIWYSKGLRNSGSHLIDICNYFFGPAFGLDSICITDLVYDHTEHDPTISFSIKYKIEEKEFPIMFQAADERFFSLIEIDLLFEKARFRIYDFGGKIEVSQVEEDPVFPGYKNLIAKRVVNSDINKYGYYMCNYLVDLLEGRQKNISSLKHEKTTYSVISQVQNKIKKHE